MRTKRLTGTVMLLALLGPALGACGTAGDRSSDVAGAAAAFERMLRAHDGSGLCAALAPETRSAVEESEKKDCAQAITAEELPMGGATRHVDVYGRQARAVMASDTLFLSQFPDGWKVVAAGCTPQSGRPYQCTVEGA